jgi:hypothetical protein
MLSEHAFEVWCQKLALSEQAKASICQIRSSPPSRLVRSAAGNVSGRYHSRENGVRHSIRESPGRTRGYLPVRA